MAEYSVTFWGVRGSHPVSGSNYLEFGGHTSCIQIRIGSRLIILDSGTGICELGSHLTDTGGSVDADIFLSHLHWDHIQGLLNFSPFFVKGNRFTINAKCSGDTILRDYIDNMMKAPYWPVQLEDLSADISFKVLHERQKVDIGSGIYIYTQPINHPCGGLAYRVEHKGRSCCYITDTEHYRKVDSNLVDLASDTDLLIYDSQYTDDEYLGYNGNRAKKGWGHSTWREGVRLAEAVNATQLVLFHHDPCRSDDELKTIEKQANELFPQTQAAREGRTIIL